DAKSCQGLELPANPSPAKQHGGAYSRPHRSSAAPNLLHDGALLNDDSSFDDDADMGRRRSR
ncbi:hypothetical protein QBC45DRAFT_327352, partial [Copromyces sp. CBS 386.78]